MKTKHPLKLLILILPIAFCTIPRSADAQTQPITLVSPAPNSTLNNSTVTFQWTNRTGVAQAWLAIGTKQGGTDILKWTQIWPSLSITVSNVPLTGGKVYFEFWYYTGTWSSLITNFNTVDLTPKVQLTSPAAGTTLSNRAVTFQWTNPGGVTEAWMAVGTTVRSNGTVLPDIQNWEQVWPATSKVVNVPMSGSPVYLEFWYKVQGYWKSIKQTFQTENQMGTVTLVSPLSGVTLLSSRVVFQWTNRDDVTEAWMAVGTKKGSDDVVVADLFNWQQVWPALSMTVTGIPMEGQMIYFEFWYKASGRWDSLKAVYQMDDLRPLPMQMVSPDTEEPLRSNTVDFEWTERLDVTEMWVAVGTTAGGSNIVGWTPVEETKFRVNNIPLNGRPVYFELWNRTERNEWLTLRTVYQTVVVVTCGNGVLDPGETCEGGSQSCTATGGYPGTRVCLSTCAGYGGCQSSQYCGDGIRNGFEACDDGALNGQAGKCNGLCTGTGQGTTSGPYRGSPVNGNPIAIPGRIEAEHFNEGGQGVGYYDANPGHEMAILYGYTPVFRTDTDVEIKRIATDDYAIGYTEVGEWMDYRVNVASSGTYTMRARIASATGAGSLEVLMNGVSLTGSSPITGNTGCWFKESNYPSCGMVVQKVVNLSAGVQTMRIKVQSGGIDIDKIEFVSGNSTPVCGNGIQEQGEVCDEGSQNGQAGKCNATCSGYVGGGNNVLTQKGLSLIWQDHLNEKNSNGSWKYTNPNDLFAPNQGSRQGCTQPDGSAGPERRSFVLIDNIRTLKVVQVTNNMSNDCAASAWFDGGYREMGMSVDIFIPTDINKNLEKDNLPGKRAHGKTTFALMVGESLINRPGGTSSGSGSACTSACNVQDQRGAFISTNWAYSEATGLEFEFYHYALKRNGVTRSGTYGWPEAYFNQSLPEGRWVNYIYYGKVDTNGNNGTLEAYYDGTLVSKITNLDFGGTKATPWRFYGPEQYDMVGGMVSHFVRGGPFYYARNFRLYGKR